MPLRHGAALLLLRGRRSRLRPGGPGEARPRTRPGGVHVAPDGEARPGRGVHVAPDGEAHVLRSVTDASTPWW